MFLFSKNIVMSYQNTEIDWLVNWLIVAFQVLKKCLAVLEVISGLPKQKWTTRTSESFVHMIACITYYLAKVCVHRICCSMILYSVWGKTPYRNNLLKQTLRAFKETHLASVMLDSGRNLLKKAHEAWLQMRRLSKQAVSTRNRKNNTLK